MKKFYKSELTGDILEADSEENFLPEWKCVEITKEEAEIFINPADSYESALNSSINKRFSLLTETDWYVVRAYEDESKPVPKDVLLYRKELREVDSLEAWPFLKNEDWPILKLNAE